MGELQKKDIKEWLSLMVEHKELDTEDARTKVRKSAEIMAEEKGSCLAGFFKLYASYLLEYRPRDFDL